MRPTTTPANIGDLRWRVRFDRQTEQADPAGGTLSGWETQFYRAAKIEAIRGGESVQAQRLQGTQPVLIIVRFGSQTRLITSDWRAVEILNGVPVRYYAIKTAEDMERERTYITILAVQGEADGGTPDAP